MPSLSLSSLSEQRESLHVSVAQSVSAMHFLPRSHFIVQLPPQSASDSSPFLILSVQLGAWHFPELHILLLQSSPLSHCSLVSHFIGQVPPQSMSVSSASRISLKHVSSPAMQRLLLASHCSLSQSLSSLHLSPLSQASQPGPPQSTS